MFRVKTTRRNIKRALSPLKPASDPMAPPVPAPTSVPSNVLMETVGRHGHGHTSVPAVVETTAAATVAEKQEKQMTDLFAAEAASVSLTKPWLRLERGIRMQKLRTFADNYEGLSVEDKDNLYKYLVRANDSKLLNTKQQIQYEYGLIQSIKGLKIIRTGDPTVPATFKIESHRLTKRNTSE
jgi:hypothetical protein